MGAHGIEKATAVGREHGSGEYFQEGAELFWPVHMGKEKMSLLEL